MYCRKQRNPPLVVCFGEMLIDFVPTTSGISLAEAPAFKKAPRAPANVDVGIACLGGSSAFIGKVGEDEFGYMLADILKENNVNNRGMCFDPGARTALAFVTLRSDGELEFMFYHNPSADMLLQESELDFNLIKKAKIFYYGSISLITEPCKSAHIATAKAAKDAGLVLSYDLNLRLLQWPSADSAREGIFSIWETADIIKVVTFFSNSDHIPTDSQVFFVLKKVDVPDTVFFFHFVKINFQISEEEISFLTKGEDPYDDTVVCKLYHPNLKLLLVTEGLMGEYSGRVKGIKVDPIDTTGAGDAFVAGILSQLSIDLSILQNEDKPRESLMFANSCGALTVMERGTIPALPTRKAVFNAMLKCVA
ncbi:hypothetical protein UlMin_006913 [Ulmus minor]